MSNTVRREFKQQVQCTKTEKISSPEHRKAQYHRLGKERKKQVETNREVWTSCTRNNVEEDESYFVLSPAADW